MSALFNNSNSIDGTFASSVTFALNITGSDRYLNVGAVVDDITTDITGITYNSVALSFINRLIGGGSTNEMWELINPDTGNNNVVVNWNSSGDFVSAGAISVTGVDQTTPSDGFQSSSGTSTSASVNVTSATDDFVIDSIETFNTASVGAGQTQRYAESGFDQHKGSTEPGASSVTMSWSFASTNFNLIAVNVKQVVIIIRRIFTIT